MKKLEVVVQPFCLDEVMDALTAAGIAAVTARSVKSFGTKNGHTEWYRGIEYTIAFAPEVAVNGIAPGLILPPPGKDAGYLEALTDTVPLKRHGDEWDIAEAARYLLTSTFVTGAVLFVDGGRHLIEYKHG